MQLKYSFETMALGDHIIGVPVGEGSAFFHGVVKMDDVGLFIFDLLKTDTTEEAIVNTLRETFDAPDDILRADVRKYVRAFTERGLLV